MTSELELRLARFRRTGREDDFRALYRLVTPRLLQLSLRLAAWRRPEAEEILQETWLRACRALDGYRGDSSFSTWLGGIAVNVSRERSRRRLPDDIDPAILDRRSHPDSGRMRLAAVDLERGVARLPERARHVLVLHDIEGWTHKEIASALGIVEGTSKRQLHDARKRLRTFLTDEESHGTD